ncbi:PREP1 [Symbiodinium sp. KB8]|nr:PREP1 [Symbiodinium sp. KB8]
MLVPVVPDGQGTPGPGAGDVLGALTQAHGCWCFSRQKDRYVDLLRLETDMPPGVGKRLPLPREVKFRGILPEPVISAVGSQGRRSYSFLPREDARALLQRSAVRVLVDCADTRSLNLSLQPELAEHLMNAGLRVPKKSVLYQFRQSIDFASMLWARKHLFAAALPEWHTHMRLDSSPQFSRNYLVGELDRVELCGIRPDHDHLDELFDSIRLQTRLMPLQVLGKQATSTAYKAKSCLRMLALEADDVEFARCSVRSLLSDMGVESGLWQLPTLTRDPAEDFATQTRCFEHAAPLADGDHMLHHCMTELELGFSAIDKEMWACFDSQLNGLAKVFSKRDHLERYLKTNILNNDKIPAQAKQGLTSMFRSTCPTYNKSRWHFMKRKDSDRVEAMAGERTCTRDKPCRLAGRRLIELSCGKAHVFLHELEAMKLETSSQAAVSLRHLQTFGEEASGFAERVKAGFSTAQRKIMLRFEQGSSYCSKFPWNIVKLLGYTVAPKHQRQAEARNSRVFAAELCSLFDAGELQFTGTFAARFFSGPLFVALRAWACVGNEDDMDTRLFRELFAYGVSLVAMQRLEGRHHLVNLRMSTSRASTATTVSAALRRRQNKDVHRQSFRDELEDFLQDFQSLIPEPWNSMAELQRLISGQHLDIMFQDVSREELLISAASAGSRSVDVEGHGELVLFQQHIKSVMKEGSCYAVPISSGASGTVYDVLQLLSCKPAAKKYMERVAGKGEDKWVGQVAVAKLGRTIATPHVSSSVVIDVEVDPETAPDQLCPYPCDSQFSSSLSSVEAFPVHTFFKYGFEHIYEFQVQRSACVLSEAALEDAAEILELDVDAEAVAAWLVQRNLAARTSDGGLVLLSCSLQTVTELEKPMLVTGPEDSRQNSLWGLRRRLQKSGWSQGSAATASAQGKIFNFKNSFKQYWCLLLDRSSAALDSWTTVIFITANVTLSRSRLPNLRDATKVEIIPKNMTAAGYAKLADFLLGKSGSDPRRLTDEAEIFRQPQTKRTVAPPNKSTASTASTAPAPARPCRPRRKATAQDSGPDSGPESGDSHAPPPVMNQFLGGMCPLCSGP